MAADMPPKPEILLIFCIQTKKVGHFENFCLRPVASLCVIFGVDGMVWSWSICATSRIDPIETCLIWGLFCVSLTYTPPLKIDQSEQSIGLKQGVFEIDAKYTCCS